MNATPLIIAALAALVASPAQACSPVPLVVGNSVQDGACGIYFNDDAYLARGISDAENLGGGYVAQYYFEGNACYGHVSMIVADCTLGQAAVFGPGPTEGPMQPAPEGDVWKQLEAQLRGGAEAGHPMSVAEIFAHAKGAGFINAAQVTIPGRVGISNDEAAPAHDFDLGCGCKTFYPGSAGAGS